MALNIFWFFLLCVIKKDGTKRSEYTHWLFLKIRISPYSSFIWKRKKCEDIQFSLAEVTSVSIFVYVLPAFFSVYLFFFLK